MSFHVILRLWTMFQTGREDCRPNDAFSEFNKYLTLDKEAHPNQDDNGEGTTTFYREKIGLESREGLALMGIHTIGHFNGMTSHINYGWGSLDTFNNQYYRL